MVEFGSVCSGIEAASVAWGPLGWKAAWLAEIDPFASAVLAHHYPDVKNWGDMVDLPWLIDLGVMSAPDVLCGGTPCQAFSVAGLRKSLDDARGNLSLKFVEIANAIDVTRDRDGKPPAVIFWENVPGVLSTKDNAFGCFLAGLAGEDDPLVPPGPKWTNAGVVLGPKRAVAWRVLDAQYFGVAQRRRRVFVVASARDGFDPAEVLFEWDGMRRDTAPSRKAGETITPTIRAGAPNGGPGHGARSGDSKDELITPVVTGTLSARTQGGGGLGTDFELSGGLIQQAFGGNKTGGPRDVSSALSAHGGTGRHDFESETFVTHSLRGEGFDASEDGTGRGTPLVPVVMPTLDQRAGRSGANSFATSGGLVPVAFVQNSRDEVRLMGGDGAIVGALAAETGAKQQCYIAAPVAFHPTQDPISSTDGSTHALGCGSTGGQASVAVAVAYTTKLHNTQSNQAGKIYEEYSVSLDRSSPPPALLTPMAVRRLTAVECERLQGFPDKYTRIPTWTGWRKLDAGETPEQCVAEGMEVKQNKKTGRWRVKDVDGPRYKALGNSWAVPNVAWIGRRIDAALRSAK